MPSSLRTRLRRPGAGSPATPRQYALLVLAAAVLVALVVFALGRLVTDSIDPACSDGAGTTVTAAPRC